MRRGAFGCSWLFDVQTHLAPVVSSLKGNYTVTTGKQQTLASFQQKAAEDFLKSRLYGPRSGRSTSKRAALD